MHNVGFINPKTTVHRLDSKLFQLFRFSTLDFFLLVWAEINCTVHVVLPKWLINQTTGVKSLLFWIKYWKFWKFSAMIFFYYGKNINLKISKHFAIWYGKLFAFAPWIFSYNVYLLPPKKLRVEHCVIKIKLANSFPYKVANIFHFCK